MDAVLQYPTLVVVRAQSELALLVGVHGAASHAEAPVGCHVSTPLKGPLVPCPSQLVLAFVDALGGHLGLPAGLVLDVVALAAEGNGSDALLLQLEQARLAVAPLVLSQPGLLVLLELSPVVRLDSVFELVVGEGKVHAVRVHLDEFKVSPVEVVVEELVVELEHAKLRKLVDHDANLEGAVDGELLLAKLDLVRGTDLFEIFEPGGTQVLVDLVLILRVQGLVLPLHRFDELAVSAVAQELEHLSEKGLVLVGITLAPVVGHLLYKPLEDLSRLVVDGAVDSGQLETVVEVPMQEGCVQEDLLRGQDPQKLLLLREALSATVLQVVVHVLWHRVVGHAAVDEEGRKLLELGPQLLWDFDVHFREPEPLLAA